jgi:hypothetical protein
MPPVAPVTSATGRENSAAVFMIAPCWLFFGYFSV